jgi:glycine cleavage system H protein
MGEFLEIGYDKFVFKVKVGCLYSREGFWAEVEEDTARIGLTDFLQKSKGDVAFLETVNPGTLVKQGKEIGKIETIKAVFDIISVVTGKIVEVNPELENRSYLINEDPYGSGWIYKIELTDFEGDRGGLLGAEGYLELIREVVAQEMKKK